MPVARRGTRRSGSARRSLCQAVPSTQSDTVWEPPWAGHRARGDAVAAPGGTASGPVRTRARDQSLAPVSLKRHRQDDGTRDKSTWSRTTTMRQRPSGISRPRRVRAVGGTARPGGHSDRSGRTSGDRRRCATGRARRRRQRLRGQPTPGITGSIPDRVEVGSHAHRVGDQTGIPVAIAQRAPSPHPVGVARHERLGEHDQLGVRRSDLAGGRLDGPSAVEEHRCGLDRRHRQRSADSHRRSWCTVLARFRLARLGARGRSVMGTRVSARRIALGTHTSPAVKPLSPFQALHGSPDAKGL